MAITRLIKSAAPAAVPVPERGPDLFDKLDHSMQVNSFLSARKRDLYPFFCPIEGAEGPRTKHAGKDLVLLAANSYLGLTTDPAVIAAAVAATRTYGVGTSGSPLLNGTMDLHVNLEKRLAAFMRSEACALFSTGFQTNLGAISCLVGRGDVVLVDQSAHASIHDGSRLSFGDVHRFKHNDLADLEALLVRSAGRAKLIVVDGVYSMDGDLADLPGIVRLARRYGARVMLDDSHGFGVLGATGRGTAEHFGLLDEMDLIMLTFSKALGTIGGCILASAPVVDYIKHSARSYVFSATLPPGTVAATTAALDRVIAGYYLRVRLAQNVAVLRRGLLELGYDLLNSATHILPVHIGSSELALQIGCALLEEGVLVGTVISPGVPIGQERLRVSAMASHSISDLDVALRAFERVGAKFGITPCIQHA